jgi:hypothetical protein
VAEVVCVFNYLFTLTKYHKGEIQEQSTATLSKKLGNIRNYEDITQKQAILSEVSPDEQCRGIREGQ